MSIKRDINGANLDDADLLTASALNDLVEENLTKSSGTYKYIATTTSRRIKSTSLAKMHQHSSSSMVFDSNSNLSDNQMSHTAKLIAANHRQLEYITSNIKLNLLPSPLSTFFNHEFNYKYFERANNKN